MYTFVVGCVETDGADTNLFNELRVLLNEMFLRPFGSKRPSGSSGQFLQLTVDSFFLEHKKEHPISRMLL